VSFDTPNRRRFFKINASLKIQWFSATNIDATLSAADLQAIKDAFAVVLNKLPFLISLTADDRKSIVKTGSDSLTFVNRAFTAAQANPTIFPASFSTPAFGRDCDLFASLTELTTLANQVAEQIDDTRMAVGGEAMRQAMQTYEYVKTGAKTNPGGQSGCASELRGCGFEAHRSTSEPDGCTSELRGCTSGAHR
jgi:hypothetical protein